jgi:hypothetical protein
MNERSSRSHTILTLYVSLAGSECDPEAVGAASGVVAQLNLVDHLVLFFSHDLIYILF